MVCNSCQVNTTGEGKNDKGFLTSPHLKHDGYIEEKPMDSVNKDLNSLLDLLSISL